MMISMTTNIGDGPLLKTYDNMLHNKLLPSTYNGSIIVVGITSVKLTNIMHTLGWTLFLWFYRFQALAREPGNKASFMYAEIIHESVYLCFSLCLCSVQEACHDHWVLF